VRLFRGRNPSPQLHVNDPRFDHWEVVADYEELETALAFRDGLRELGLAAELTADYPLDEFRRGDIALRVPADQYGDATVALAGLEP
jgi:catechol 2,3-dioxygenase-like lactoylglutathione lyase family enzyme